MFLLTGRGIGNLKNFAGPGRTGQCFLGNFAGPGLGRELFLLERLFKVKLKTLGERLVEKRAAERHQDDIWAIFRQGAGSHQSDFSLRATFGRHIRRSFLTYLCALVYRNEINSISSIQEQGPFSVDQAKILLSFSRNGPSPRI